MMRVQPQKPHRNLKSGSKKISKQSPQPPRSACCVDVLQKVLKAAAEQGVTISKVLTTHKHHDHAGGNNAMASEIPGLEIVGGEKDRVQGATVTVEGGDVVSVGGITVKCLHTAG